MALLMGCVVIAVFTPPQRSPDNRLRQRVLEHIAADPVIQHLKLEIAVASGVATLDGEVTNRQEQERAVTAIAATDGVMDVIDNLTIDDAVIRRNVIEAFNADPGVANIPVTVTCADGEVELRSNQTNAEQRRRMVQIATSVDGVVQVIDDMK